MVERAGPTRFAAGQFAARPNEACLASQREWSPSQPSARLSAIRARPDGRKTITSVVERSVDCSTHRRARVCSRSTRSRHRGSHSANESIRQGHHKQDCRNTDDEAGHDRDGEEALRFAPDAVRARCWHEPECRQCRGQQDGTECFAGAANEGFAGVFFSRFVDARTEDDAGENHLSDERDAAAWDATEGAAD